MKVLYVYRNPAMGISIGKTYSQIEKSMKSLCDVDSVYMPEANYRPVNLLKNILYTCKYLKGKNYDIVHITGAEHYLIPFLRHQHVVVTVHDFGFYTQRKKTWRLKMKSLLWIRPLSLADKVICISEKTLKEAKELASLKDEKTAIVHEPVGHEFTLRRKAVNTSCPVFLQIGTRPHKNLKNTILALDGTVSHLRIVGKLDEDQKRLLTEHNINYSNTYDLTDEEIVEEYEKCDIVNFISLHEGFGMIVLEGQAVGRVVVTSNIPPMTEVADGTAIMVDPNSISDIREGYKRALTQPEKYIELGLHNVGKYTVESAAKKLYAIYETVVGNNR